MTRISFFFLIRQDDICQLTVRELSGQRDCKSIHFLKPFPGEAPSTPKVIRTNVGLKQAHTASTETALVVAQSVLSHLEDTQQWFLSIHQSGQHCWCLARGSTLPSGWAHICPLLFRVGGSSGRLQAMSVVQGDRWIDVSISSEDWHRNCHPSPHFSNQGKPYVPVQKPRQGRNRNPQLGGSI